MKKAKRYFVIVLFMAVSCFFLMNDSVSVEAANVDFCKKYSFESSSYIYFKEEFKLNCKCKLNIRIDAADGYHFEEMGIEIGKTYISYDDYDDDYYYDDDDEIEFEDEISLGDSPYSETITLPAGEYEIYVYGDIEYFGSNEEGDRYSEQLPCLHSLTLTGEYIPELSDKSLTLEEGQTKTLQVKGTRESVTWESSDKKIASVNSKGLVSAKKTGKATITAVCGKRSLKCKVTVKKKPVDYSQMAKKMKKFARKNKNFTYKTVKEGKECRLYAMEAGGWNRSNFYENPITNTNNYKGMMKAVPYLQLIKKNNKVELRLRVQGYMEEWSVFYVGDWFNSSLKLDTSNRKMNFTMDTTYSDVIEDYRGEICKGNIRAYATISTSSNIRPSNLKKFNTMLGQKSLSVKMVIKYDDVNASIKMSAKYRNNWKKLVKEYNTLLEEF